jgi:hypothetical protein
VESAARRVEHALFVLLGVAAVLGASILGCYEMGGGGSEQVHEMSQKTIEQVQEEHTDEWMAIPGVVGTAIGLFDGKPCIRIFSSSNPQQLRAKIPSTVEGYPVIIEETGEFRALDQQ